MNFSDYMDTCCTELKVTVERGTLPLMVDVLDAEIFVPLLCDKLSHEQYCALFQLASRLICYHYDDVK